MTYHESFGIYGSEPVLVRSGMTYALGHNVVFHLEYIIDRKLHSDNSI